MRETTSHSSSNFRTFLKDDTRIFLFCLKIIILTSWLKKAQQQTFKNVRTKSFNCRTITILVQLQLFRLFRLLNPNNRVSRGREAGDVPQTTEPHFCDNCSSCLKMSKYRECPLQIFLLEIKFCYSFSASKHMTIISTISELSHRRLI